MARLSRPLRFVSAAVALALLVSALVVLVPSGAEAAAVLLTPANVSQLDASGAFEMFTTVTIPAGERVPLDFAEVLISPPGTFASGTIDGSTCIADNMATSGARVEVLAVTGGESVYGHLAATRHDAVTSGSGYDLGTGYSVDYGYGYGYGSTDAVTLTVHLKVIDCFVPSDFPGMPANPQATFDVQVLLGHDMAQNFPSVPVQVTLMAPLFEAPGTPAGSSDLLPGTPSSSGGQSGISYSFMDTDADGTPFEPVAAGSVLGPFLFPAGLGAPDAVGFTVTTTAQLPAGSQLLFTFQDDGAVQSADSPPFGIDPAILGGQLRNKEPAFYFQVLLSIPGEGFVLHASDYISITITLSVPDAYFTAGGGTPNLFHLIAFGSDGTLEGTQPVRIGLPVHLGTDRVYTFSITVFSSFAGAGRSAGGGGGNLPAPAVDVGTPVDTGVGTPPVDTGVGNTDGTPDTPVSVPTRSAPDHESGPTPAGGHFQLSTSLALLIAAVLAICLVVGAAWSLGRKR